MNIRESVLKLFSGSVVVTLVEFCALVGFTRVGGTEAIGYFFVFQAVVGMLGIPIDLGVSRAAEKLLSADEPTGEVISTAVVVKFFLALPWLLGLVLAGPHVERYVGIEGILPFVVLGLLANQARRLSLRLLAGQLRVEQNALLKVMGKLVWIGSGFALIYAGWGPTAIIAAFVLGNVTTVLGALVRLDLAFDWPRRQRARELVDFGRYVFVGSVGGFVYQWMDVAILRLFVPVSLIGAYELAWRVASVSMMLTGAIRTSLFPQISRWHAEDRLDKIESAFYKWLQVPLYLTIPAFAGAVVLGEVALETVFGAEVAVAYPVLLVFMLEKILRSVQLVLGPSLFAMDKPQLGYRGSMVAIVVNLTLNLTLIPVFGVMGAAVATTLGAASAAFVAIMYVNRFVEIRVPWTRIAWSTAASVLMAGGVVLIQPLLDSGWTRVVFGVGTGIAFYLVLLLANEGIRLEMRGMIAELMGTSS